MSPPRRTSRWAIATAVAVGFAAALTAAGWFAVTAARGHREAVRQRDQDAARIRSLVATGDARRAGGDLEGAIADFRRAERLLRGLDPATAARPIDAERRLTLAGVRLRLSGLMLERGDVAGALVLSQDVAADTLRLTSSPGSAPPGAASAARGEALRLVGLSFARLGRSDEAIDALRAAVPVRAGTSTSPTESGSAAGDREAALAVLADLLERRGDLAEASLRWEQLLQPTRPSGQNRLPSGERRLALARAECRLADLLLLRGEIARAGEHLARAGELLVAARTEDPGEGQQDGLRRLRLRLALQRSRLELERGEPGPAERFAEEALESAQPLLARHTGDPEARGFAAEARLRIAAARLEAGAPSSAIGEARMAADALAQLAAAGTSDADLALAAEAAIVDGLALDRLGHSAEARSRWGDAAAWLTARAAVSRDPRLLDPLVRSLLLQDRAAESAPFAARLAETGYALPSHVARCRAAALPVARSGDDRPPVD